MSEYRVKMVLIDAEMTLQLDISKKHMKTKQNAEVLIESSEESFDQKTMAECASSYYADTLSPH